MQKDKLLIVDDEKEIADLISLSSLYASRSGRNTGIRLSCSQQRGRVWIRLPVSPWARMIT